MTAAAAAGLADGRCLRMWQLAAAVATLAGASSRAAQRRLQRQQPAVAQGGCRETALKLMGDPGALRGSAGFTYLIDKKS